MSNPIPVPVPKPPKTTITSPKTADRDAWELDILVGGLGALHGLMIGLEDDSSLPRESPVFDQVEWAFIGEFAKALQRMFYIEDTAVSRLHDAIYEHINDARERVEAQRNADARDREQASR